MPDAQDGNNQSPDAGLNGDGNGSQETPPSPNGEEKMPTWAEQLQQEVRASTGQFRRGMSQIEQFGSTVTQLLQERGNLADSVELDPNDPLAKEVAESKKRLTNLESQAVRQAQEAKLRSDILEELKEYARDLGVDWESIGPELEKMPLAASTDGSYGGLWPEAKARLRKIRKQPQSGGLDEKAIREEERRKTLEEHGLYLEERHGGRGTPSTEPWRDLSPTKKIERGLRDEEKKAGKKAG